MKVLVAVALCGLAVVYAAASGAQPEVPGDFTFAVPKCSPNNGEFVELIPNPDNCTTYFACNYGQAIEMRCVPGLHFNAKLKVCDSPANACCDPAYDPQNKCKESA